MDCSAVRNGQSAGSQHDLLHERVHTTDVMQTCRSSCWPRHQLPDASAAGLTLLCFSPTPLTDTWVCVEWRRPSWTRSGPPWRCCRPSWSAVFCCHQLPSPTPLPPLGGGPPASCRGALPCYCPRGFSALCGMKGLCLHALGLICPTQVSFATTSACHQCPRWSCHSDGRHLPTLLMQGRQHAADALSAA